MSNGEKIESGIMCDGDVPRIPIGMHDFIEIREGDYLYVDKSEFITELVETGAYVPLLLRPNGFGKSVNLSMLDAFFNLEYKGNHWFDGLKVMGSPRAAGMMNRYPVIHLRMGGLPVDTFDSFLSGLGERMSELYRRYLYLLDSDNLMDWEYETFQDIVSMKAEESYLKASLDMLCNHLRRHHDERVIVLIDDYEDPTNSASEGTFDEIRRFLWSFYSRVLKGNGNLEMGILTAEMMMTKASNLSGDLNNLNIKCFLSYRYGERFGFTYPEVENICRTYGNPEASDEAIRWYGGYHYGDTDVCNPESFLRYIRSGFEAKRYWENRNRFDPVGMFLFDPDHCPYWSLLYLGGGSHYEGINEYANFDRTDSFAFSLFSVLGLCGIIGPAPKGCKGTVVPNLEMYHVLSDAMIPGDLRPALDTFLDAAEVNDVPTMASVICNVFGSVNGRYSDTVHNDILFLAMIVMSRFGRYKVDFDRSSNLLMTANGSDVPNIAMRFCRPSTRFFGNHHKQAERTLSRFYGEEHIQELKGHTILYGVVFHDDAATIVSEERGL